MHSITLTGGLADELGDIYLNKLAEQLATEVHADVLLHVRGGKHHAGLEIHAYPPAPKLVRLVKLSHASSHAGEKWMWQARHGKNSDGEPFNAAGGAVTFSSEDEAKAWILAEPSGRWRIVL